MSSLAISGNLSGMTRSCDALPSLNCNPVSNPEQQSLMTHKSAPGAWQPLGDIAKRIVEDSVRRMATAPEKKEAAE